MARDDIPAEALVAAHALLPPQEYVHTFALYRLHAAVLAAAAQAPLSPGLRRVKICRTCHSDASGSSSSSSGSSSQLSSSSSSSARSPNGSARSLAARKLQQIVTTMAPIVVDPPVPVQSDAVVISRESLAAAWEIGDLDTTVHWVDATLLDDVRVIGSGGNGVVWLVRHREMQTLLAAKRLIGFSCGDDARAKFVDEVRLVATLRHARIVAFVGAAWTTQLDLQALFEFMPNGDLRNVLTATKSSQPENGGLARTPWKLQVAIDVADALAFVHAMDPPLVHRDVKSKNVLMDENARAKLTDFGVSRFQSSHASMTTGVGTGRWLASEVLNGGGDYGTACDVYSLGVLLSELDTHDSPYSAFLSADDTPLPEMRLILLIAAGKVQPSFSCDCPTTLRELALACLSFDAASRPCADEVAARLRAFQSSV